MSFRGLTLREAWRFSSGPVTFILALALKAIGFRGSKMWLPGHESERLGNASELSADTQVALAPLVAEAANLGYTPGRYIHVIPDRNPSTVDAGAYLCLHRDGNRILHLARVVTEAAGTATSRIHLNGAIVDLNRDLTYDFCESKAHFDGDGYATKFHVREATVTAVDAAMRSHLEKQPGLARKFASLDDLKRVTDRIDAAQWHARVGRGLFLPIG